MNILEEVRDCRTVAISGHINPDGDCVGSCMGMALYLEKERPDMRVDVFLEKPSDALMRNIPGTNQIRMTAKTDVDTYDAFICLDSDSGRIGHAKPIWDKAKKKINIDHHKTNPGSGDVNLVDGDASSACEMVCRVIDHSLVDEAVATALYIGMVTDTGVFRYSNTSEETMRTAGWLMTFGFDFSRIVREVFFERTFKEARALGLAFSTCTLLEKGRVIECVMDHKAQKNVGIGAFDLGSVAAQMVLTAGVDCAVFAYEKMPGEWKFSFRSNQVTDVAAVAGRIGGGGHVRAAGATVHGDITPFLDTVHKEISAQLHAGAGEEADV